MNYSFELNNAQRSDLNASGKINAKSTIVEVFSAMTEGKELSQFGKKADVAANYIKDLGNKASAGDLTAVSELNEIRKFAMQPRLLQEIKLLGIFGSYKPLAWGDTAQLETTEFLGVESAIQAEGTDVSFPFKRRKKTPLAPITISGGYAANYRELALGDMASENQGMEEVRKDIRNKASLYVIETVFKAVEAATGVKYFYEASTLAKSGVDGIFTKVRRYGKPNVNGDYAILAQFLPWIGYSGTVGSNTITGVSQKLLDEISDTGIVGSYNGAVLKEIENGYNFNKKTSDGLNYATLLPSGLAFVTPTAPVNGVSPIQTFSIGGLTSFSGNDVTTGSVLNRFDLSIACGVAATDAIGIIHDSSLDTL